MRSGRRAQPNSSSSTQPLQHEPDPGASPYTEELYRLLQDLPDVYPGQTAVWVPRGLKQQAAEILYRLLREANLYATRDDEQALCRQMLLRAAPILLFRTTHTLEGQAQGGQRMTDQLRPRLTAALSGDWHTLVRDALAEIPERRSSVIAAAAQAPAAGDSMLTLGRAQAAAAKARTGSVRAAANILTGAPPVQPSAAATAKIRKLFYFEPRDECEQSELDQALAALRSVDLKHAPATTPTQASRRIAQLKAGAGPGPSGWRNSHLQVLHSHRHGPHALAAWASLWKQGSISPAVALLWTHALVRPFYKANMIDLRPILCGEALLKFAVGSSVKAAGHQLAEGVGKLQFGAGTAGGAAAEVHQVRAAARLFPDRALASLDVANAFGSVKWAHAIDTTIRRAPALARTLLSQWQAGRVVLHVEQPSGIWEAMPVYNSLLQGGLDGHQIYCLLMADLVSTITAQLGQDVAAQTRIWIYVDDILIQTPPAHLQCVLALTEEWMSAHALRLQRGKCQVHIPGHSGKALQQLPQHIADAIAGLQWSPHGITILGTDATADMETWVGADDCSASVNKRLARAEQLATAIGQLIDAAPPAGARQPAWHLVRQVLSHALDYDARILPLGVAGEKARALDTLVWPLYEKIIGTKLSDRQKLQLELPARYGGLQCPAPSTIAPLARAAALAEGGPVLRQALIEWGLHPDDAAQHDFVDEAIDAGILARLAERGVHIGPRGVPGAEECQLAGHLALRAAAPAQHLLSQYLEARACAAYQWLLSTGSARDRCRQHSAGGRTAGASLVAPMNTPQTHFHDAEWTILLRWRLGLPVGAKRACQNMRRKCGTRCADPTDSDGEHAMDCPVGGGLKVRHDGLCDNFAQFAEEAGAVAMREVFVPEFRSRKSNLSRGNEERKPIASSEAWLDVHADGVPDITDFLGDVTVCHPAASRYIAGAASTPGYAAERRAAEKRYHYVQSGGRYLTPLPFESWGRAGQDVENVLDTWAAAANRRDWRHGRAPNQRARRWRCMLDASIQHSVARMILSSHFGYGLRPCPRPRIPPVTDAVESAVPAPQ